MAQETLEYLHYRELKARLEDLQTGAGEGAPKDWPEYCSIVGEIRGIRFAMQSLNALRKRFAADEELRDGD
jgi:hypothetical protein